MLTLRICLISLVQCDEPFGMRDLYQQTFPIMLIFCLCWQFISFLDNDYSNSSAWSPPSSIVCHIRRPSLKCFKTTGLLIPSGPQAPVTSLMSRYCFFIALCKILLHIFALKHEIPFSATTEIWSSNLYKLTLNSRIVLLVAMTQCISCCSVTYASS